jgi:hypothetical protein
LDVKFVIFAALSVSLVASIYGSSSVSYVCAKPILDRQVGKEECITSKSNPYISYCCATFESDKPGQVHVKACRTCTTDAGGGKNCGEWEEVRTTSDSKLAETLPNVTASGTNDTKVPNTDVLKDLPLAEEDNGDTKVPKVPDDLGGLNDEDEGPTTDPELPQPVK